MSADAEKARAGARTVGTVQEFLDWVEKREGRSLLYRGLADANWGVQSAAYRRIKGSESDPEIPGVFKNYISQLLEKASMRDFRTHEGNELSDLKLLARLQHLGAATCLIDFTQNPLVALWFACQERLEQGVERGMAQNGKVVVMDTDVDATIPNMGASVQPQSAFGIVGQEQLAFKESEIVKLLGGETLWIWDPTPRESRVIAQQSIFVFGPAMIKDQFAAVHIPASEKKSILRVLDKKFGISQESLFGDFAGFALANAHDKPYAEYNADDYYELAVASSKRDEKEKAIQFCDKAIAKNQQHSDAHYLRGTCHYDLEKWQECIEDFSRAIEIDPTDVHSLAFRGLVYEFYWEKPEEAKEDYTKIIEVASNRDRKNHRVVLEVAYKGRGRVRATQGDHSGAIEDFTSAISIAPGNAQIYRNRAKSERALGNEGNAQADEKRANKIEQPTPRQAIPTQ